MNFLKRNIDISLIIILLIAEIIPLTIVSYFIPMQQSLWQGLLYITLLFVMSKAFFDIKIEWRILFFIAVAMISIILSDTSQKYNAPLRLMMWVVLISAVGPLLYNEKLIDFRKKLFDSIMYMFMIIGSISFLYWMLGLPNLGRGHFTGITVHSMLLAPIASLGAIYAMYRYLESSIYNIQKYMFSVMFIFNTISVLLAASRSSLVAFLFAVVILLYFQKFRYKKIITIVMITIFILGILIKMINENSYHTKQNSSEIMKSMEDRGLKNTREALWKDRLNEFHLHPIFGVGFASQEDKILSVRHKNKSGNIEPGSTYLMILSMTGIVGAFAMFFFLSKALFNREFWRQIIHKDQYKFAVFGFFFVHFLGEGYLFASGALMAFVFWTLVGATYPYSLEKIIKESNSEN